MPRLTYDQAVHRHRRVWAALSADPGITIRELARRLDVTSSAVQSSRIFLRDAGYIDFKRDGSRATRVVVPFRLLGQP